MRLQVEIGFSRMDDIPVNHCARKTVVALPISFSVVTGEEADMVPLANNNHRDLGIDFQIIARLCFRTSQYLRESTLPGTEFAYSGSAEVLDTGVLLFDEKCGMKDSPVSKTWLNCPSETPSARTIRNDNSSDGITLTSIKYDPTGVRISLLLNVPSIPDVHLKHILHKRVEIDIGMRQENKNIPVP